ncbi:hypothetical protein ACSLBF_10510 [Pseudoalteromonas sp. T1lg65]|uniref:hypothetical protein n=1 Tax=Pseudoalteromonas sp. T1lg65 TaxID=2077101 RepID=UPI003F799BA0
MSSKGNQIDINTYKTTVRMSSKVRILVEGPDDKAHISNLLKLKGTQKKFIIDVADHIRGDCQKTRQNNKERILKIHALCKDKQQFSNLFYLCDREFYKFDIAEKIEDNISGYEVDSNLNWTTGHSLENYFLSPEIIADAYSYQSGSEFKLGAIELLKSVLPSAISIIAALSLAARDISSSSYPCKIVKWQNYAIREHSIELNLNEDSGGEQTEIYLKFVEKFQHYLPTVKATEIDVQSRICRGHTAITLLQRVFSACIFHVGREQDETLAIKDANKFSSIKENSISNALCQAWLGAISNGYDNYPIHLVDSVA